MIARKQARIEASAVSHHSAVEAPLAHIHVSASVLMDSSDDQVKAHEDFASSSSSSSSSAVDGDSSARKRRRNQVSHSSL